MSRSAYLPSKAHLHSTENSIMQMRFVHLLNTTVALSAISHSFTISQNLTLINHPLNNTILRNKNHTLSVPEEPPRLALSYEIGGAKLNTTSCLMSALSALKTLALGDWVAKIQDSTEYRDDAYPEVSITVNTPRRKRSLQARYVVWAIFGGVRRIMEEKRFEFTQVEVRWDGELVGWVHFVNNAVRTPTRQGLDVSKRGSLLVRGRRSDGSLSAIDPDEARLEVSLIPVGERLGIYDVFLPIMNSLTDMAAYSSTLRSDALIAGFQGRVGFVCLLPTSPLEYMWLARTIARIPRYMLEERRFGEVAMVVSIDGVKRAIGRVSKAEICMEEIEKVWDEKGRLSL